MWNSVQSSDQRPEVIMNRNDISSISPDRSSGVISATYGLSRCRLGASTDRPVRSQVVTSDSISGLTALSVLASRRLDTWSSTSGTSGPAASVSAKAPMCTVSAYGPNMSYIS